MDLLKIPATKKGPSFHCAVFCPHGGNCSRRRKRHCRMFRTCTRQARSLRCVTKLGPDIKDSALLPPGYAKWKTPFHTNKPVQPITDGGSFSPFGVRMLGMQHNGIIPSRGEWRWFRAAPLLPLWKVSQGMCFDRQIQSPTQLGRRRVTHRTYHNSREDIYSSSTLAAKDKST